VSPHDKLSIKRRDAIAQITRLVVRATDDIEVPALDMPVGRGWREAGPRPDGLSSRGTGPDTPSVLAFDLERGHYDIELRVLGAVTPQALEALSANVDDGPLTIETAYDPVAGFFRSLMSLAVEREGPVDLLLTVPHTKDGYGLEVAGIRVRPHDEESSVKRRATLEFQPTRQVVRATEDVELLATEMPVVRGWRQPGQRPDGSFTRGTGPDTPSVLAFDLERGRYDIELRVLGAVTAEALQTFTASADDRPLTVETIYDPAAKLFRCSMVLEVDRGGPVDLELTVPLTSNGYGLEVGGIRLAGQKSGSTQIERQIIARGLL
jgi:hypothetical protein